MNAFLFNFSIIVKYIISKNIKHHALIVIATISLVACINSDDVISQYNRDQAVTTKQQCLAELQTLQQTSLPLYYNKDDEPVYRELPTIESFHCSIMPDTGLSIQELNKEKL